MTVQSFPVTDRASWLEMRKQDITASIAGAMVGVHDYTTPFQIWAEKTGLITDGVEDNPAMKRGRLLEPVAFQMVAEDRPEWRLEQPGIYLRDPEKRIGATPDLFAFDPDGRKINVQVKTTADMIFKQKWRDPDTREIVVPLWIAIQSMIEAELAGCDAAYVALMVVGMGLDLHLIEIPVHHGVLNRVKAEIAKFWTIVDAGGEIAPDFAQDGAAISRVYSRGDDPDVDLTGDNEFAAAVDDRVRLKSIIKETDEQIETVEALIKHKLGNAAVAVCGSRLVTWKLQRRKSYVVKESEFRVLRVA